MTYESGSIRNTGTSVRRCTSGSSRLSRISSDSRCRRWSGTPAAVRSVTGDQRPHVLAVEGARDVARFQAVDHLDAAAVPGALHEVQHRPLDDDVLRVELLQLADRDPGDEGGVRVLLRVGGVEALLVLDEDHAPGTEHL